MIAPTTAPLEKPLATEAVPNCPVCQRAGDLAYADLVDRLYSTPGAWGVRRCPDDRDCGTFWLDPRPTPKDIGRAYEMYCTHSDLGARGTRRDALVAAMRREYLATRYGYPIGRLPWPVGRAVGGLVWLFPGFRASFDLEVRGLGPQPGARLLDVGCGEGRHLAHLQALGWQVEGVELDREAVQVARSRGISIHEGTLESRAFEAGSFDVVTMSHVIEHLHQPDAVLRECLRILKPGGRLVVATPNVRGMMHKRYRQHWLALDPPRHLTLFTQQSLRALATRAGFASAVCRTTVRDENMLDFSSRMIRATGHYRWGDIPPLHARLKSELAQFLAPIRITLGMDEGDEILMLAVK